MDEIKLYEYDYDKPDLTEDFLEHHGILGMHWGRKNGPPYPLGSDKSTGKRLKTKGGTSKRKAKKTYKRRVKSLKKARKAREVNRQQQIQKQKSKDEIIKSKDISSMLKNVDLFSNKEIDDMLNRLDTESKLASRVADQKKANRSKGEKIKEGAKSAIAKGIEKGASNMLTKVSQNALEMSVQAFVKSMAGENNEQTIDKLFKDRNKKK